MIENTTKRTPLFLMANLGSEVSKIISAKENNDTGMLEMAVEKAKSIFEQLEKMPHSGEVEILHDVVLDLAHTIPKYHISSENLKSYFLPFAIRLMQ